MEQKKIEQEIKEIHEKLDFITQQLQETCKHNQEMQELKNDLALVGKDMFDAAVEGLEDVAPYFDTSDLLHLGKKLLRNTRNLNRMLTQLESAEDLFHDLKPLGKQMFDELLETLNELDRKGYFEFFGEAFKIIDTIVTTFDVEDVRLLRENIASILLTIKDMTQPEMLNSMNNALDFFKKMDVVIKDEVSFFTIMKKLRDPEVKKGIAFSLEFIKNMAQQGNGHSKQA
ncbi:MAG TPA: DUF1641 domain-containing protein [Caldithrix abyssi]|uniref:DUF1641 domain-containing protein n=1 Tax=Caldithrix abyssi TaxID=187145 RepID=A0A7V4TYK3_CALAY|nr:DUF1641 domain-containing protein [Caldithrix abyssi]